MKYEIIKTKLNDFLIYEVGKNEILKFCRTKMEANNWIKQRSPKTISDVKKKAASIINKWF